MTRIKPTKTPLPVLVLQGYLAIESKRNPLNVMVWPPVKVSDEEYASRVVASLPRGSSDCFIHGMDERQAEELAIEYAYNLLGIVLVPQRGAEPTETPD